MAINDIQKYITAATRENTVKSRSSSIRHFEVEWGGRLPTTPEEICKYLSNYAESLSVSTLKVRLSSISKWHDVHGFQNPTADERVKLVLKGIGRVHKKKKKKAIPTSINEIYQLEKSLNAEIEKCNGLIDDKALLRLIRDKAIVSIMFWKAMRPSGVVKIDLSEMTIKEDRIEFHISETKNFSAEEGRDFTVLSTNLFCPVSAIKSWIEIKELKTIGPLFHKIDRHGNESITHLHYGSVQKMLNRIFLESDIKKRTAYTLRRGFATWAASEGWTLSELQEYVGWKDSRSALSYIETNSNNIQRRLNNSIQRSIANDLHIENK